MKQREPFDNYIAKQTTDIDKIDDEQKAIMLKDVSEWLGVGVQQQDDHAAFRQVRSEHTYSTDWILRHEYVISWLNTGVCSPPVLWIHGIPGAGTSSGRV